MSQVRDESHRRGDIVEMRFCVEASRRGLIVSRPHEKARYDFLVDCHRKIWRVQVKSTTVLHGRNAYRLAINVKGKPAYRPSEVDFIAAYVIPTEQWYIIPLRAIHKAKLIYLHPRSVFAKFKGAWHLLLHRPQGCVIRCMQAVAEPSSLAGKK